MLLEMGQKESGRGKTRITLIVASAKPGIHDVHCKGSYLIPFDIKVRLTRFSNFRQMNQVRSVIIYSSR